jgi:hypothetical protein
LKITAEAQGGNTVRSHKHRGFSPVNKNWETSANEIAPRYHIGLDASAVAKISASHFNTSMAPGSSHPSFVVIDGVPNSNESGGVANQCHFILTHAAVFVEWGSRETVRNGYEDMAAC